MGTNLKKLGEAELEIMQVIWDSETSVTSNFILKELQTKAVAAFYLNDIIDKTGGQGIYPM